MITPEQITLAQRYAAGSACPTTPEDEAATDALVEQLEAADRELQAQRRAEDRERGAA